MPTTLKHICEIKSSKVRDIIIVILFKIMNKALTSNKGNNSSKVTMVQQCREKKILSPEIQCRGRVARSLFRAARRGVSFPCMQVHCHCLLDDGHCCCYGLLLWHAHNKNQLHSIPRQASNCWGLRHTMSVGWCTIPPPYTLGMWFFFLYVSTTQFLKAGEFLHKVVFGCNIP